MAITAGTAARLGGRLTAGAAGGCAGCGHPIALHKNGTAPCTAFACHAGPSIECPDCGGIRVTAEPCKTCSGVGTVSLPCQAFAHADQVPLAS